MWAVEAQNFGIESDYFYMSGLSYDEARDHHRKLNLEGWAKVRSFKVTF